MSGKSNHDGGHSLQNGRAFGKAMFRPRNIWKAVALGRIALWSTLPIVGFILGFFAFKFLEAKSNPSEVQGLDLLFPISTSDPRGWFPTITHTRLLSNVGSEVANGPIPTNKFFGNLLLPAEDQSWKVWAHPYVVEVGNGTSIDLPAIIVSHSDWHALGPTIEDENDNKAPRVKSYTHHQSLDFVFGARRPVLNKEEEDSLALSMSIEGWDSAGTAVRLKMQDPEFSAGMLEVPIVRGMAYVTVTYHNLVPVLTSEHCIIAVNALSTSQPGLVVSGIKFRIALGSGEVWVLYSLEDVITMEVLEDGCTLKANAAFTGTLRAAKLPLPDLDDSPETEQLLDEHRSVYPTGSTLKANVDSDTGTGVYGFDWDVVGEGSLLHFAFPHHQHSFQDGSATATEYFMQSTTKGMMRAYIGNKWQFEEPKLIEPLFLPSNSALDLEVLAKIQTVLVEELSEEQPAEDQQEWSWSNYFTGKILLKQGQLCLISHYLGLSDETNDCISKLRNSYRVYITNTQINSLLYDVTFKGLIGKNGLTEGNEFHDFGASYYNDHHYHYGYIIHAAAILAHLDELFLEKEEAQEYIDALARDVANPSAEDSSFPVFRSFDWFSGHCWSQGLFGSDQGKDQESTSEEMNFHLGLALWGAVTDRPQLEHLGRLMATVASASIRSYFLLEDGNEVHPREIVGNKVTGIYFENGVEYKTWFGENEEYIHGIQVLPILPNTEDFRSVRFISEEWDLVGPLAASLDGSAWQSLLYMSYAMINQQEACQKLETAELDSGLSRTWALFWCASRSSVKPFQNITQQKRRELQTSEEFCPSNEALTQSCEETISLAEQFSGLGIFYDSSCGDNTIGGDVGCRADSACRLCALSETQKKEFTVCPVCTPEAGGNRANVAPYDFHTWPCSFPESTPCAHRITLQQSLSGLGMYHDPVCSSTGGVGCVSDHDASCRLCASGNARKSEYLACPPCISTHFEAALLGGAPLDLGMSISTPTEEGDTTESSSDGVIPGSEFPIATSASSDAAAAGLVEDGWCSLPEADEGGPCVERVSLEEAMSGLGMYYDESCQSVGGVGCNHGGNACRLCAVHPGQKTAYVSCPPCVSTAPFPNSESPSSVVLPGAGPYTFGEESCTFQTNAGHTCLEELTFGQLADGLALYYDQSCGSVGGVGCLELDHLQGCRLCGRTESQQENYVACPPCITDGGLFALITSPHPQQTTSGSLETAVVRSEWGDQKSSFQYNSKEDLSVAVGCGLFICLAFAVFGVLIWKRKRQSETARVEV